MTPAKLPPQHTSCSGRQPSLQEQVNQLNARIVQVEHDQKAQLAAQRQDLMCTEEHLRARIAHLEAQVRSQEQDAAPRQTAQATGPSR